MTQILYVQKIVFVVSHTLTKRRKPTPPKVLQQEKGNPGISFLV